MVESSRVFRLVDEAGVRGQVVVDLDELATTLHSWYISPDHPDVVEDPETRSTIVHAHDAIDELVERVRRGEPADALEIDLDVTVRPCSKAHRPRRVRNHGVRTPAPVH